MFVDFVYVLEVGWRGGVGLDVVDGDVVLVLWVGVRCGFVECWCDDCVVILLFDLVG